MIDILSTMISTSEPYELILIVLLFLAQVVGITLSVIVCIDNYLINKEIDNYLMMKTKGIKNDR
jgi:hypothetical protein